MQESLIFYRSFYNAIKGIGKKETRAELYDMVCEYGLDGTIPEKPNEVANAIFELIKPQIDANIQRRENGYKGAEHGIKGGRPKNPIGVNTENPIGVKGVNPVGENIETPNDNVNDNDNKNNNDNVNDNVNEKGRKKPNNSNISLYDGIYNNVKYDYDIYQAARDLLSEKNFKALIDKFSRQLYNNGTDGVKDIGSLIVTWLKEAAEDPTKIRELY